MRLRASGGDLDHHQQEDACYDLYITSLSPDNLAGAEEVIGWGGRSSPREKYGER